MKNEFKISFILILFGVVFFFIGRGEHFHHSDGIVEYWLDYILLKTFSLSLITSGSTLILRNMKEHQIGFVLMVLAIGLFLLVNSGVSIGYTRSGGVYIEGYEIFAPLHVIFTLIASACLFTAGATLVLRHYYLLKYRRISN